MSTVFIYALKEPDTGEIRYIGKANDPVERCDQHIWDAIRSTKKSHKNHWIRFLLGRGLKPDLEILDEVPAEYWQQWEVAYIEFYREQGLNLVNTTLGGEGHHGAEFSCEHKQRISESTRGHIRNQGLRHRADKTFVGVRWEASRSLWLARIGVRGKEIHLGRYESEIDAAHVYDYAARAYYGKTAKVNFP